MNSNRLHGMINKNAFDFFFPLKNIAKKSIHDIIVCDQNVWTKKMGCTDKQFSIWLNIGYYGYPGTEVEG